MRVRGKFVIAVLVCLLAAGTLMAQSTRGSLKGSVSDDGGQPLPGVTVALSSPNLQGQKSAVTDAVGAYRFVLLPPGTYKAKFALPGYQRVEQENIKIGISQNLVLDVTLKSAFTEEVVVSGEAPLVDVTSSDVGTNLSQDFYTDLPVGRNYTSVASVTPGAQADGAGQTFYGSTGSENAYYIDGANTTGVELGQQGKVLNFEFIQEVQVKTGGYNAEYGRNTGGMINVITKSGGNEFHGDVFGYYESDSLQANLKQVPAAGAVSGTITQTGFTESDYGVDVGGYIIKDALWFFAAYDYVKNEADIESNEDFSFVGGPTQGEAFKRTRERDLFAVKLTWRLSDNHSLSASIFGDPSTFTGAGVVGGLSGPPTHYLGGTETGGTDGAAAYDGVFGENWVVSVRYAQHKEKTRTVGPGRDLIGYIDFTDPLGDGTVTWGWGGNQSGYGFFQDQDFTRQQYNGDLSYFLGDFFGQHEFKVGYEYEHIKVKNNNNNSGGQRIYRFPCSSSRCPAGQDYYYRHRYFIKTKLDPLTTTTADINNPLTIDTKADNYAAFVQDRWQVTPTLTLNVGLRWDHQQLYNALGEVSGDIKDEWGPRLGFVWDFMGNGKSKLFGHFGRFYETIPMDIVIRSFGGEITVFSYNYSDDPNDVAGLPVQSHPDDTSTIGRRSSTLGGGISRVDPQTKGQFITEYVAGVEYEVAPNLSVGIKGIYRDLGRVIEDALSTDGDYFIGNPGQNELDQTFDIGIWYVYYCPDGTIDCHFHKMPSPKRTYTGIELTAEKRFSNNFQFLASALWSRLYGNYDGTFQASTGQLDPNLNSAYDYYDFSVNNNGYLSGDRRQQYKFDGIYRFDWGLSFGLSAHYRTGTPITAMGYSTAYNNWEYYLSERGVMGRVDSDWEADVHIGYPIKLGGNFELNLMLDIFNVFNRQGELTRSQRYDLVEDYQPLDWVTGLPNPPITPGDVVNPPTNPSFNTSTSWQAPRSVRIGARLSF